MSFVQDVGTDEPTIVRTLTLGVCQSDDIETILGLNELTDLLEEDTLTFKDGLKTQDLVRCQINFV